MPTRDPKTGRQLSGAAKRAAQKAKAAAYATAAASAPQAVPTYADYASLPPPPIGKPAEAIAWCNDALVVALGQVMRDPALPNLDRWRWIKDLSAVIGMCRDKSSEQARIKKLAEAVGQSPATGSAPAGAKSLASVQKPDTARRHRRGSG